eukprot:scaffold34258_cov43-Phaeocystis_antarctica.AAC.2
MSRHRSSAACPSLPASRWVPFVAVAVFLTVWNRTINFAPTERVIVRSAAAAAAGHPPPSSQAAPPLPPPYLAPVGSPPSQVTAPPSVAPWRLGRPVLVFSGGQEGDSSTLKPSPLSLSLSLRSATAHPCLWRGWRGLVGSGVALRALQERPCRSEADERLRHGHQPRLHPPTPSCQHQATGSSASQPSAAPRRRCWPSPRHGRLWRTAAAST